MDEAEGLSEEFKSALNAYRQAVERRQFSNGTKNEAHWTRLIQAERESRAQVECLYRNARAEPRSTPDREGRPQIVHLIHRALAGDFTDCFLATEQHERIERLADAILALARPASSAGGVEEALAALVGAQEVTRLLLSDAKLRTHLGPLYSRLVTLGHQTTAALAALRKGADRG